MQKVKKSKKVEEPEQMQEPGKRKRKEVESSKAIAKAGKTSKPVSYTHLRAHET